MEQEPRLYLRDIGGKVVSEARWAEKVKCRPGERQLELGLQGRCTLCPEDVTDRGAFRGFRNRAVIPGNLCYACIAAEFQEA